ncbi:hypothetical protein E0663_17250 [Salmonella enterica subsp. enterica]|nr:hypothetical protein [Salmonella enterica subsp. enterica]
MYTDVINYLNDMANECKAISKELKSKNSWFNKLVDIAYYRGYPIRAVKCALKDTGFTLHDFMKALEEKDSE